MKYIFSQVEQSDHISNFICSSCFKKLTSAYVFQQTCQKSYHILKKSYIRNNDSDMDVVVPETIESFLKSQTQKKDSSYSSTTIPVQSIKETIYHEQMAPNSTSAFKSHNEIFDYNDTSSIIEYCFDDDDTEVDKMNENDNEINQNYEDNEEFQYEQKMENDFDDEFYTDDEYINNESGTLENPKFKENCFVTDRASTSSAASKSHGKVTCDLCNKEYLNVQSLAVHLQVHVQSGELLAFQKSDPTYSCDYCYKKFRYEMLRDKHIECHHINIEPQKCLLIQHDTVDNTSNKNMIPTKIIKCDICNRELNSMQALAQHLSYHVKNGEFQDDGANEGKTYNCSYCRMKFRFKMLHKKHVELMHLQDTSNGQGQPISWRCPYCESKFSSLEEFKNHKSNCIQNMGEECDICIRKFLTRNALTKHLNATHFNEAGELKLDDDQKNRQLADGYQCRICDIKFNFNILLIKHMQSHIKKG